MSTKYDHQEAIRLYATGDYSFAALGRKFNVDRTAVQQVIKAKAPHLLDQVKAMRKSKTTASAAAAKARPKSDTMPLFAAGGSAARPLKAIPKGASPISAPAANLNTPPVQAVPAPVTKGTPMRTQIELIGPAEAQALLKINTLNRPLSETTIRRYVQDMIAGAWQENAATIVISRTNRLLDGQHRLHAIVRSGATLRMLVSYDVDDDAFHTIDNGKTRSAADVLSLAGVANAKAMSTSGKLILNYVSGAALTTAQGRVALVEFVEANPQVADVIDKVAKRTKIRFPKSALGAVLALANSKGLYSDKIDEFLEAIETGAGLEKGDPRLTLREWEGQERARSRNKVDPYAAFGATARAWNAFAKNTSLTTIRGIGSPSLSSLVVIGYEPGAIKVPRAGLTMPETKMTDAERAAMMPRDDEGKFQPRDGSSPDLGAPQA